jgi:hypothetical protein
MRSITLCPGALAHPSPETVGNDPTVRGLVTRLHRWTAELRGCNILTAFPDYVPSACLCHNCVPDSWLLTADQFT